MEKSSSVLRALACAALVLVVLISLFLPVVTVNSAEAFSDSSYKIGYYNVDLQHAGKIKVSLVSVLFATGKDVNTLTRLYKLREQKELSTTDAAADDALQAEIDEIMNDLSDKDDTRIQLKLKKDKFVKKVALRASMYNADKDSSHLAFGLALTLIALAILLLDITLKAMKLVKSEFEFTSCTVKKLSDIRLPAVAFVVNMLTVQHYIAKTRGITSLGGGIILGLLALIAFAVIRGIVPVLKAKEIGGDQFKKTVIKQSITLGVLLITVIIALLGMKMSGLMINDMQMHYSEFEITYLKEATKKIDPVEASARVTESMNIIVSVIAAIPAVIYLALGYMLIRTAVAEKPRRAKSRKPKTYFGSFYIGFIFIVVAYVLTLLVFTSENSQKRSEMYVHCQNSIVFTEYKEEGSADNLIYKGLVEIKDAYEEQYDEYKQSYKDEGDKETKAEIKQDMKDTKLEISAVEKMINRIEDRKKANVIAIIALATVAIAAEIVFKSIKFESEKIAASGKDN